MRWNFRRKARRGSDGNEAFDTSCGQEGSRGAATGDFEFFGIAIASGIAIEPDFDSDTDSDTDRDSDSEKYHPCFSPVAP